MERLNFGIKLENNKFLLELGTIINGKISYSVDKDLESSWPIKFFTATTDMRDFIGNVLQSISGFCNVYGVYRGYTKEIKNIKVCDKSIKGMDRVIVSEHINVDGKIELIATKKRILISGNGSGLNFMNIGFSNEKRCKYLRIDVYTGESKLIEENNPCFANMNIEV